MEDRINICAAIRAKMSNGVAELLMQPKDFSEIEFRDTLREKIEADKSLWPRGWYEPPPVGIAILFSNSDDYRRLQFDTLRKEEFWPSDNYSLKKESVGIIYASPVDRLTGIIGDWGGTIYRGSDLSVRAHFQNCLATMEQVLERIASGIQFREIHDITQSIFEKRHLTNRRTVTWTDESGTNLGHTIPWSYIDPTENETVLIQGDNFDSLKDLISHKRIYVNRQETFVIPETIAFTLEARLEDLENQNLPNVFLHYIVTFKSGVKEVLANFNTVFEAAGMDYIKSKY